MRRIVIVHQPNLMSLMFSFLVEGGLLFTGPLTLCGLAVVALTFRKAMDVFGGDDLSLAERKRGLHAILQIGLFSFFFGILGQAVGILGALKAIEQTGTVSPAMLSGGLQVSMIAPVYGLVIFLIALAAWSLLSNRLAAHAEA